MSLRRALFLLIATALLAGIVPAGVMLDRGLTRELEARTRDDLARAPRILSDRTAAIGSAMMMYAKELAQMSGLSELLERGATAAAARRVEQAAAALGQPGVLVGPGGAEWLGPQPPLPLIEKTRLGEMPVEVVGDSTSLRLFALAPVMHDGNWLGAAGVATPLDTATAETLAGLTRSDVVLIGNAGVLATSADAREIAPELTRAVRDWPAGRDVMEVAVGGRRFFVSQAQLGDATVLFARDMQRELGILPRLRRVLGWSGAGALVLGLFLGTGLALVLARPVRALALAADRVREGDFEAPLPTSRIHEVSRVTQAFGMMRRALAAQLEALRGANRELEDRQAKLTALQAELIQRERLAVSGRLVAELAHEIRNPVANLRNCLELLHRRLRGDAEGREFASLAIDELLRMHELAERMLDLNRPRDPEINHCSVVQVVREVCALVRAGTPNSDFTIDAADAVPDAAIGPDSLKQVLLNLVQNARDACPEGLQMEVRVWSEGELVLVQVRDHGPGVPPDVRHQIFDPFFTTKSTSGGVGLGLSVAQSILHKHGGRITLLDPEEQSGPGAVFQIEIPGTAKTAAPAMSFAQPPAEVTV